VKYIGFCLKQSSQVKVNKLNSQTKLKLKLVLYSQHNRTEKLDLQKITRKIDSSSILITQQISTNIV
jgi:hypothetical protein